MASNRLEAPVGEAAQKLAGSDDMYSHEADFIVFFFISMCFFISM